MTLRVFSRGKVKVAVSGISDDNWSDDVKRLRTSAGLSQAELAEVDRAYVSVLELGQRNPTVVLLWHMDKALREKLSLFFDEKKSRGSAQ